ncbi:CLPC1 [Symbiodinium natans]|uniref:CLPC1 protein n=1 Tax=Symbiodinium natans TaxID=878477 RepID=A0A812I0L7_9DINO|nr:CLPC1 [Symbiodinium natans]
MRWPNVADVRLSEDAKQTRLAPWCLQRALTHSSELRWADEVKVSSKEEEPELHLTETLRFAEDLTAAAEEGHLDPLVGREAQLERTIRILGRRSKNNPVFVGEAGVGKTSIACGLAQRIVQGRVPPTLRNKRVLSLDLALLLAGTRYRGDFEERLRAVVKEVSESNRRVILVIDEVHTLVGAGSSGGEGGGMDAANLLKPALARGQLQCIGATTLDEYRQYIEKDPALERRFQPVLVPEPTEDETEQILLGLAPKYERHHQLRYEPESIRAAVRLAAQYINDRFLPDKAIDVMDEAGAKVRQQLFLEAEREEEMAERRKLEEEMEAVREQKAVAVSKEEFQEAQRLKNRQEEIELRLRAFLEKPVSCAAPTKGADVEEKLRLLRARVEEAVAAERFDEASELKAKEREVLGWSKGTEAAWVTETDVAQVVAGWTGIAVEQVSATESARLMKLEQELAKSVVGQAEAVSSASRALRRARAGLRNPSRPIAALMFCGPTGVGKTALCKTLASCFFGSEDSMIRLDMSEFMEKHTVSKLIGAPPGYVGYGEGGTLTESVRRRPYSLVLFDEVEKAHPDVFNTLLQLLDDGRLTDSKGRVVSFSNTLVVMTSNIGSRSVQKGAGGGLGLGFGTMEDSAEQSYQVIRELVHEEMKSFFRPEFLNRLDEICVFRPLTKENIRAIAEVEFDKVAARLLEAGLHVSLTARFKERVVQEGFDPAYGARPLRRAITRWLEDSLAEHLLDSTAHPEEESELEQRALVDLREDGSVQVHRLPNVKKEEKELTEA